MVAPENTLQARLTQAMRHGPRAPKEPAQLLRECDDLAKGALKQQSLQQMLDGTTRESARVPLLAHVLGVECLWLAYGVGPMLAPPVGMVREPEIPPDYVRVTIPRKRHALLQSWAVLPESTRVVLRMHIETLASAIREGYWDAQRQIAVEDLAAQTGKHKAATADADAE